MSYISPYDARMRKAYEIVKAAGVQHLEDSIYRVISQSNGGYYRVKFVPDPDPRGLVIEARCTCPDWQGLMMGLQEQGRNGNDVWPLGVPHISYWPACKHVLAVALKAGVVAQEKA